MVVELLAARCTVFRGISSVAAQIHGSFGVVLDGHSASSSDQRRLHRALVLRLGAKRHGGVGSFVGNCRYGIPMDGR